LATTPPPPPQQIGREEEWRRKKERKEEGKMVILWIKDYDDGMEWIELYECSVTSCCNTL